MTGRGRHTRPSPQPPVPSTQEKVISLPELLGALEARRARGERIVLTNGAFDLLHVGHVRSLRAARALGDVLVLALNSDASVRGHKGPSRPFVPEEERAETLAALADVDYVVIFEEPTAERVVEAVRPDVYAKGSDYTTPSGEVDGRRMPEARVARSVGAEVRLLPYLPGHSTTDLARRIAGGS